MGGSPSARFAHPKMQSVAMAFQSDRLRMLAPRITATALDAATRRVVDKESLPKELSDSDRKVALLLVRELNPDEILGEVEEAHLRGVRHETLKKYKNRSELPRFVNGR